MAIAFLNHKPNDYKIVIDHINNNPLDNRLANLQLISQRENNSKDQWRHDRSSQHVGVSWVKRDKKWRACIGIKGRNKLLGVFASEKEASQYYQNALKCIQENRIEDIEIKEPNYSSKYKGVYWRKNRLRWVAYIKINGKQKSLGHFKDEYHAHLAYQKYFNASLVEKDEE